MLTVRAAAIAQGTLLFCAMGACAPAPRTIGVSIQNLHSEFYTAVENGIRNDAGNNAVDVRDAESDAEQQNEVEASIARNVDAIAIVPVDSTMIGSAALEANTAKIPVFMADINSTSIDSTVAAYIASNNFQGGASAAELMCEGVHGHASVAIIDQPEVSSVRDRVAGFRWAVKHTHLCKTKRVSVGTDVDAGVRHASARRAVADIMQAQKDVAGIFFVNDESLLAALPRFGSRKPCATPILVGYDAIEEVHKKIVGGFVYGDARQHPDWIGQKAIDEVHDYFNGKRLIDPRVTIGVGTDASPQCAKGIGGSS